MNRAERLKYASLLFKHRGNLSYARLSKKDILTLKLLGKDIHTSYKDNKFIEAVQNGDEDISQRTFKRTPYDSLYTGVQRAQWVTHQHIMLLKRG